MALGPVSNGLIKTLGLLSLGGGIALLSYSYSERVSDWLRFNSIGTRDYVVEKLEMMFIRMDPNRVLLIMVAVSVVPAILIFLALIPQLFPAVLLSTIWIFIGWKIPRPLVDWMYKRRVDAFLMQMVDGLNLMSNALKAGLTPPVAIGIVVQEMPNPMKEEFALILNEMKVGASLEESLLNLAKRIRSDDVEMFVTAVVILTQTGGNLAKTFDTITTTIRERIKVEKKIEAMTAQGFYQGVLVAMIPPVLGFVFYQTDPDFMRPLFTTPIGWIIILLIATLEIVGFVVIMKVIKIDV
jgi:tight adherence protein B